MSDQAKPPDFSNLQESLSQQQAKISALKELVRQSETQQGKNTATAQEKVKNIAQRLTNIKSKASKRHSKSSGNVSLEYGIPNIQEELSDTVEYPSDFENRSQVSGPSTPNPSRARSETPGSDKITLLRQQMEQNRQRMADRESQNRDIEIMVSNLKSKFASSQMDLEKSMELGRSMGDLSSIQPIGVRDHNKSVSDMASQLHLNLEHERMKYLETRNKELELLLKNKENKENLENLPESERVQLLETRILDLQENVKEKDSIIDARTKAVSLLTENLSRKKRDAVDSLEETKQEMFKMQENFVETEFSYKDEMEQLKCLLDERDSQVENFEEINSILEKARYDLTLENSELKTKLENVQDYSSKISELNKLNETLQKRITDMESLDGGKYEYITEEEVGEARQATFEQSEEYQRMCLKIRELEAKLSPIPEESENISEELENKLKSLQEIIDQQTLEIEACKSEISVLQENLQEKTIEHSVLNANFIVLQDKYSSIGPKSLFPSTAADEDSQAEIQKLKQQLDDANKSQIKNKLKTKQLQKQVDSFKKQSDTHQELVKLNQEVQNLTQKVAELEEEKGNLQLHLVNYDGNVSETELQKKIKVLETTCHNQVSAIQQLEEQKLDLDDSLSSTKNELTMLQDQIHDQKATAVVRSDLQSIELEEDLDKLQLEIKALNKEIENLKKNCYDLSVNAEKLTEEKIELQVKLNGYINENMELLDKIEKLRSSGSSAASIEMVENLTQQEKLELEQYQKSIHSMEHTDASEDNPDNAEMSEELNESLVKLRDESSELMQKIEQFTGERREMLEKLELLQNENSTLLERIEIEKHDKLTLTEEKLKMQDEKSKIEVQLVQERAEKDELSQTVRELNENRGKLQEEINRMVKETITSSTSSPNSPSKSSLDTPVSSPETSLLLDKEHCEKLLSNLDQEVQNYNKNKDKHQKLKISKKLSNEAKNVHTVMVGLLAEYYKNADECKLLREELEKLKIHLTSSISGDDDLNLKQLGKLQLKYDQVKENLTAGNTRTEELEEDLKQKQVEVAKIREELLEKSSLIENLQESLQTTQNERESSEKLLEDIKANYQDIKECKDIELEKFRHQFEVKLQTASQEVEILKTLVKEQKEQIIESYQEHDQEAEQKAQLIELYQKQINEMTHEIQNLKTSTSNKEDSELSTLKSLLEENNKLLEEQKEDLRNKQETIEQLNQQIIELYRTMEENANRLIEQEDEIQYLQELITSNKDEIQMLNEKSDQSTKIIKDLRVQLKDRAVEVGNLKLKSAADKESNSSSSNQDKLKELEKTVQSLESKNKEQMEKMKKYSANLKKKTTQCSELEAKLSQFEKSDKPKTSEVVPNLVEDLQMQIVQFQEKLRLIELENSKLNEGLLQSAIRDSNIGDLKVNMRFVEEENIALNDQLKSLELIIKQTQMERDAVIEQLREMESKSQDIGAAIEAVQTERNDLLGKLMELESKNKQVDDTKDVTTKKYKQAIVNLKNKLAEKTKEIDSLKEELLSFKNSVQKDVESSMQKSSLENEVENLRRQLFELDQTSKILLDQMKESYEQELASLRRQVSDLDQINRKLSDDNHVKVSLEVQLESSDSENQSLKKKIEKLEEAVGFVEARRNSLERQKKVMSNDILEKVQEFSQNEDVLLQRISALTAQDELIELKLRESETENMELSESLQQINQEKQTLTKQVIDLESKLIKFDANIEQIANLETEITRLESQNGQFQAENAKILIDFEQKLAKKHAEIDDLENDLSAQLQNIEAEKKSIQESLEKAHDKIVDFEDEIVRMKDTESSSELTKNDLERELSWLKLQHENYAQDQLETQQLRMDALLDQSEIENLKEHNETLQIELLSLQKQIADLEAMRAQVGQNQTDDQVMLQNENVMLKEKLKNLEEQHFKELESKLSTSETHLLKAQEASNALSLELRGYELKYQELMQQNNWITSNYKELNAMKENLMRANNDCATRIHQLENEQRLKDQEIEEMKGELETLKSSSLKDADILDKELREKQEMVEKLHDTVAKYEVYGNSKKQEAPVLSNFFGGPSSASANVFDIPQQVECEEVIPPPKSAYLCYDDEESGVQVTKAPEDQWGWDIQQNQEAAKAVQAQSELNFENVELKKFIKILEEKLQISVKREQSQSDEIQKLQSLVQLVQEAHEVQQAQELNLLEEHDLHGLQDLQDVESDIIPMIPASSFFDNLPATSQQSMASLEIEDGWGWTGENVLEQQQVSNTSQSPSQFAQIAARASLLSPRSDLEVRLQEQQDKVYQLEIERQQLHEEISGAKENSKKMRKKLKEYQMKITDFENQNVFRKSASVESNELDLAIQEELNSQVQKLESKFKELSSEYEKEIAEKENMTKRIDVLTSANDRMTEMKERQDNQMEMYQMKCKELTQKLQKLEDWGEDSEEKVEKSAKPVESTLENYAELLKEVEELKAQVKDLQVDNEEFQALLEEEKNNTKLLDTKLQSLQSVKDSGNSEKDDEIEKLSKLLNESTKARESLTNQIHLKDDETRELLAKLDLLSNESSKIRAILDDLSVQNQLKTNENQELSLKLKSFTERNEKLAIEKDFYNQSLEENYKKQLEEVEQQTQQLMAELQFKDAQIVHLNDKIQELIKGDQTESLVQEILLKNSELNNLRSQVKELEVEKSDLASNISINLTQGLQNIQQGVTTESSTAGNFEELSAKIIELEKSNQELIDERKHMEHELQVLNDQVLLSLEYEDKMQGTALELEAKNIEIQVLKSSILDLKDRKPEATDITQTWQQEKEALDAHWSQLVDQRGNEIAASWKDHLDQREEDFEKMEEELRTEIERLSDSLQNSQVPQNTQSTLPVDGSIVTEITSDTLSKMQEMMQNQEMEIMSLKEQLAIRSAEYAQLAAKVDPYRQMPSLGSVQSQDSEKVPRNELDLALYMLHQRDMRLEEMTLELISLLEERDTLQLRLSSAIRQNEDHRTQEQPEESSGDLSKVSTPEKSGVPKERAAISQESGAAGTSERVPEKVLQTKISELNSLNHGRDKRWLEEREERYHQMEMIQRDVAKMPSEAAARIVGQQNTEQSPSSVLLNWILGNRSSHST